MFLIYNLKIRRYLLLNVFEFTKIRTLPPIDLEINKRAKDLDLSKNIDYLNNLLNIGYNVSKSIKFNDNSNEFISQKLEYLSNISNSQIKMLKSTK